MDLDKITRVLGKITILIIIFIVFLLFGLPYLLPKKPEGSMVPISIDQNFFNKVSSLEDNSVHLGQ